MSWFRQLLCLLFNQCAEVEIKPIEQRFKRLEQTIADERRAGWDDLFREGGRGD